jgi:hypothetical protein
MRVGACFQNVDMSPLLSSACTGFYICTTATNSFARCRSPHTMAFVHNSVRQVREPWPESDSMSSSMGLQMALTCGLPVRVVSELTKITHHIVLTFSPSMPRVYNNLAAARGNWQLQFARCRRTQRMDGWLLHYCLLCPRDVCRTGRVTCMLIARRDHHNCSRRVPLHQGHLLCHVSTLS